MRETSELYKRLLDDDDHVKESRLIISGVIYDETRLVTLSTTEMLFAEDAMAVGGAVAREIDLSAFLSDDVPKRAQIIHEVRLKTESESSEWLRKGVYYIDTRSRDPLTGVTTVHGFDAMLMAEREWIPADTDIFPMPMEDAVRKTAAALGLEIDPRTTFKTGDAYMVDYPVADGDESEDQQAMGLSIRQMWRWVAAAHGGNFIINDLGQLRLVPLNALPTETGYLVTPTGSPITFGGVRILLGAAADAGNTGGDKVFVGNRAAQAEEIPALEPIGKIILKVDDNNAYVSESDTGGLTLEVDCAYGSQRMADNLLAQLRGYVYRPVQAEDALIDPAAELGDGVTLSGIYTILAQKDTLWDMLAAADIGAPGKAELESEYSFTSSAEAKFQYQLAQTRSLIAKTAEEIRLEVSGYGNQISQIRQTVGSIELNVSSANGSTTFKLMADGAELSTNTLNLSVNAVNISGKLTANQIDATNLKVNAANITGTLTVGVLPDEVVTEDNVTTITQDAIRTASIRANQIASGTITAGNLTMNGMLQVNIGQLPAGYIGASQAGNTDGAVLCDSSMRNYLITTLSGVRMSYDNTHEIWVANSGCHSTSTIQVYSDKRLKNNIRYDLEEEAQLFRLLRPCSFQMNNDLSEKRRWGFIAQDFIASAEIVGMDPEKLGAISEYQGKYAFGYGEMIPLNTYMIQQLMERMDNVEEKINAV